MTESSNKAQTRHILQNTCPVSLKAVKVIKKKLRKSDEI
jgi:hypothetical protein